MGGAVECDWHGQVAAVVVNTTDWDKYFDLNETVGFFDPIRREKLEHGMSVESLLSQFASEPKKGGRLQAGNNEFNREGVSVGALECFGTCGVAKQVY